MREQGWGQSRCQVGHIEMGLKAVCLLGLLRVSLGWLRRPVFATGALCELGSSVY